MSDHDDQPLPGLEPDQPADGAVLKAARRTLRALEDADQLTEQHAVMAAALVTVARQLDRAANSGRAKEYAVANLVAQLRDTWTALVPETQEGGSDAFDQLATDLRNAAAIEARRAAALRDPA